LYNEEKEMETKMAKTFTNPLGLKADTHIKADKILEGIEILRFQGLVPDSIRFSMVDKCPECSEAAWGLFLTEEAGSQLEAEDPLGICLQCGATIYVDRDGKPKSHVLSSQDLLKGMGIGKGK
jgi:hypothetical protein